MYRPTRFLPVSLLTAGLVLFCSCSIPGGEHVVTLAKLHNLKVAMSHITQLSLQQDITFPKNPQDIVDFIESNEGDSRSKDEAVKKHFVDGWGNEMRFEGTVESYIIRSSGPDQVFDTDDDIYLAGSPDTEYIIDGVKESKASGKDLLELARQVPFQEANGYYRIKLPGKYAVIRGYDGWKSKTTFRYTANNTVIVVAEPYDRKWSPAQKMKERIRRIESGMDDKLWDYEIVESGLTTIDNARGFEIVLDKADSKARVYELLSNEGLHYSISIIASGEDRQFIMDALTEAVQNDLELRRL